MENNTLPNRVLRWATQNVVWEIVHIAFWAIYSWLDPFRKLTMGEPIYTIPLYFLLALGTVVAARFIWRVGYGYLVPPLEFNARDLGMDSQYYHKVGFKIVKPKGNFEIELKRFWLSQRSGNSSPVEQYYINPSPCKLEKIDACQFSVATQHGIDPRFGLVVDGGYYGSFILSGIYKARILVSRIWKLRHSFDVTIELTERHALMVVNIEPVNRNAPLDGVAQDELPFSEDSRNWIIRDYFNPVRDTNERRQ